VANPVMLPHRPDTAVIVEAGPHHAIGRFRNVAIAIWVDDTPVAAVETLSTLVDELAIIAPHNVGLLQLIGSRNERLPDESRAAIETLLRASREVIRCAPVVYAGTGFKAAVVRAIVAGMLSLKSYGFPHRVFASLDEAALSLGETFDLRQPTQYARDLSFAVATIRERHGSNFPASRSFISYDKSGTT
jgi:hypothetical protein